MQLPKKSKKKKFSLSKIGLGSALVLLLHGGLDDVARYLLLRDGDHPAVGELGDLLPPQLKHPETHVGVQLGLGRDDKLVVVVVEAEVAAADAAAGEHLYKHGGFEQCLAFTNTVPVIREPHIRLIRLLDSFPKNQII